MNGCSINEVKSPLKVAMFLENFDQVKVATSELDESNEVSDIMVVVGDRLELCKN